MLRIPYRIRVAGVMPGRAGIVLGGVGSATRGLETVVNRKDWRMQLTANPKPDSMKGWQIIARFKEVGIELCPVPQPHIFENKVEARAFVEGQHRP